MDHDVFFLLLFGIIELKIIIVRINAGLLELVVLIFHPLTNTSL